MSSLQSNNGEVVPAILDEREVGQIFSTSMGRVIVTVPTTLLKTLPPPYPPYLVYNSNIILYYFLDFLEKICIYKSIKLMIKKRCRNVVKKSSNFNKLSDILRVPIPLSCIDIILPTQLSYIAYYPIKSNYCDYIAAKHKKIVFA